MLLSLLAAASLAQFEATLAAQDSATAALTQWCEVRHMADPARIRAVRLLDSDPAQPALLGRQLDMPADVTPGFRHVRLACGKTVMSEAFNWYVRDRLTAAMNSTLDKSDIPFGTVAAPLKFRRERLETMEGPGQYCPRGTILAHHARLVLPDGRPLALLIECYTADNLTAGE